MNTIREKFRSLSEREQKMVLAAGVMVVVALFYFAIWAPLSHSVAQAQLRQQSQQELLSWVQEKAARAAQLRGSGASSARFTGSLAQAVSQAAAQQGIPVSRMQPANDELQVWIEEAPFNAVVSFLHQLEQRGISVLQLDITEASAPGLVKIRRLQLGTA